MNSQDTRHRLSVDIDSQLYQKLQEHVPWGVMKHLIHSILTDFVHLCEKHDSKLIIGAILSEEMSLRDFLNKYEDKEEKSG